MIIHYCDRCGRRLKEDKKDIFKTITDTIAAFAGSLKRKEPAFRFEIREKTYGGAMPGEPAELCEKCEKDFETWFRGPIPFAQNTKPGAEDPENEN